MSKTIGCVSLMRYEEAKKFIDSKSFDSLFGYHISGYDDITDEERNELDSFEDDEEFHPFFVPFEMKVNDSSIWLIVMVVGNNKKCNYDYINQSILHARDVLQGELYNNESGNIIIDISQIKDLFTKDAISQYFRIYFTNYYDRFTISDSINKE